jgi:very-short-patch-repair endonuclease
VHDGGGGGVVAVRARDRRSATSPSPLEGEGGSPRSGETDGGQSYKCPLDETYTTLAQTRARELRRNMTDAERRLWSALRAGRLQGLRFRRQQPIGNYIADFYCAKARLVVEIDGSQHSDEETLLHDYHRTKWLESKGYRVIRFTNHDVLKHTPAVVEGIWATISPPVHRTFEVPAGVDSPPSVAPLARQLPPQGGKRWVEGEEGA